MRHKEEKCDQHREFWPRQLPSHASLLQARNMGFMQDNYYICYMVVSGLIMYHPMAFGGFETEIPWM